MHWLDFLYFGLKKNWYKRDCIALVLYYLNHYYLCLNRPHIRNIFVITMYWILEVCPLHVSGERKSLRKPHVRCTGSRNGVWMEPRKEHWYNWLWQNEDVFSEINQQEVREEVLGDLRREKICKILQLLACVRECW